MKRSRNLGEKKEKIGQVFVVLMYSSSLAFIWALPQKLTKSGIEEFIVCLGMCAVSQICIAPILKSVLLGLALWSAQRSPIFDGVFSVMPQLICFLQQDYPDDTNAQLRTFLKDIAPSSESECEAKALELADLKPEKED